MVGMDFFQQLHNFVWCETEMFCIFINHSTELLFCMMIKDTDLHTRNLECDQINGCLVQFDSSGKLYFFNIADSLWLETHSLMKKLTSQNVLLAGREN